MKFNIDFQGVKYVGEGNFATEETLSKLLAAYNKMAKPTANPAQKAATDALNGLADSADDAGEGLEGFSDELESAEAVTKRAANKLKDMGERAGDAASSLFSMGEGSMTVSSMVSKFGDFAGNSLEGLGKLVPWVGDGIGQLGEQAATVAFGLAALAVAMIESYSDLNREILSSGISLEKGFDTMALQAAEAGIPLQSFSAAVMANVKTLKLFAGGAPGGIKSVSAAFANFEEDTLANLYSMGFSTEEVVAAMASYGADAAQAGKQLAPAELASETSKYLKNLRELSIITGVSVKEAQDEINANRSNLFIQNQLAGLDVETRAAMNSAISMIPEAYKPMADYIVSGQSANAESLMLVNEMGTVASIWREGIQKVKDGVLSDANLGQWIAEQNTKYKDQINAEIADTTEMYGQFQAAVYGDLSGSVETYGAAVAQAAMDIGGSSAVLNNSLDANTTGIGGAVGQFEKSLNEAKSLIQNVFNQALIKLAPLLSAFVEGVGDGASGLSRLTTALGEILGGDFSSITELFEKLGIVISDAITNGFSRKLNPLHDYTVDKTVNGQTVEGYSTIDGIALKTAELGLDTVDFLANSVNGALNALNPLYWSGYTEGLRTDLDSGTAFSDYMNRPEVMDWMLPGDQTPDPIAPPAEDIPHKKSGGRVRAPMTGGLAMLHGTEAVVPLPDGKSIPVDMSGFRTALEAALAPDSDPTEVANAMDELANTFSLDSSKIIDGSRTMPELLQVNKSLLQQYFALNEKFERMVKAMEDGNNINRSAAFARA